jgi:ketosteroid isomerase-like protein
MKKFLSLILTLTVFTMVSLAQSKEEKEVTEIVETLRKAMIDANQAVLEKIVMDQLIYGHSGGSLETKKELIESLVSGKSDFVTMDLTEQTITISGNTAIVHHKLAAETNNRGVAGTVKLGVLLVFQKQKTGWKLLARQAVKI